MTQYDDGNFFNVTYVGRDVVSCAWQAGKQWKRLALLRGGLCRAVGSIHALNRYIDRRAEISSTKKVKKDVKLLIFIKELDA